MLCVVEGTPIKSHIVKFNYMTINLKTIDIQIDNAKCMSHLRFVLQGEAGEMFYYSLV